MSDQASGKKTSEEENSLLEEEWEFTTVKSSTNNENLDETVKDSQVDDTEFLTRKTSVTPLSLDENAVPKMRTRSEMAAALIHPGDEEKDESYTPAALAARALALFIDGVIALVIAVVVYLSAPLVRSLVQWWMDKYKLHFLFPESIVMKGIMALDAAILVFFFICLPVAFYNHSFGKKAVNLKVRGLGKYSLSLVQAIQRETVYKPLSILLVVGFFIPFFNKEKMALQDYLAETVVIENDGDKK
jgi:uncharacterized RDD family membrane protein YckC